MPRRSGSSSPQPRGSRHQEQLVVHACHLPTRALRLLREWTGLHEAELQLNWDKRLRERPRFAVNCTLWADPLNATCNDMPHCALLDSTHARS